MAFFLKKDHLITSDFASILDELIMNGFTRAKVRKACSCFSSSRDGEKTPQDNQVAKGVMYMIGRFRDPFPDEIFYSVCARFSDRVQYPNKERIFRELFGNKSVMPVIDLPCHIGYLVNNLPPESSFTVEEFIDCHTLWPFYSPFLPQERASFIREQMISGSGKAIHRRAGITGSSVPRPSWLRYCPMCVQMDKAEYGEAYWHRLHQISGVEVCPVHETFIENSALPVQNSFTPKAFVSAKRALKTVASPHMAINSPHYKILKHIALDISYILNHPIVSPGSHFYHEQYFALLANRGFVTPGGLVQSTKLHRAFIDYYSHELLALLHCEINHTQRSQNTWLTTILWARNHQQNPLHYLLLMHFLGSEVEAFFHHQLTSPKLFGNGPWPCLNPVCENYQRMHIPVYRLNNKAKGRPTGHFTCDCGFSYSRSGPDHSPEDVFRRDKILSYGHLWKAKLRELWAEPFLSLNEISRRLGITLDAINRQARKLELPVPRPSPWPSRMGKPLKRSQAKPITWYRMQWLNLLDKEPEASIGILREKSPGVYSWLLRHDREWLMAHRPPPRLFVGPQPMVSTKLELFQKPQPQKDMAALDAQIAESIRLVVNQLINGSDPPKRISLRSISTHISQLSRLKSQLDKMPLTAQALKEVIESREAFALRRISWVVEWYRRENIIPTRSQLMVRACVYPIAENPQVKQAIDTALEALS